LNLALDTAKVLLLAPSEAGLIGALVSVVSRGAISVGAEALGKGFATACERHVAGGVVSDVFGVTGGTASVLTFGTVAGPHGRALDGGGAAKDKSAEDAPGGFASLMLGGIVGMCIGSAEFRGAAAGGLLGLACGGGRCRDVSEADLGLIACCCVLAGVVGEGDSTDAMGGARSDSVEMAL
jgi:hypothetical protein